MHPWSSSHYLASPALYSNERYFFPGACPSLWYRYMLPMFHPSNHLVYRMVIRTDYLSVCTIYFKLITLKDLYPPSTWPWPTPGLVLFNEPTVQSDRRAHLFLKAHIFLSLHSYMLFTQPTVFAFIIHVLCWHLDLHLGLAWIPSPHRIFLPYLMWK